MFGTYRILLAIMVVLLHYADVPMIGQYAVFAFFSLSGYLMTFIMQQNYGYTARGIGEHQQRNAGGAELIPVQYCDSR